VTPSEFNVIPDIHADPRRLESTLSALGSDAPPAFLGDFIDGKPGQADDAAVLERVRREVENGAPAIMGNHELNAILFHLEDEYGPFRARSGKNRKQHASFIHQFGEATPSALEWVEWFLTLPLWLDLGDVRLVHAYWSDELIETIRKRRPDARLRREDLREIAVEAKPFGRAVKLLLTGPEVRLPQGCSFLDKAGHERRHVRIAWWRAHADSWRDAALSVATPELLPEGPVSVPPDVSFYPEKAKPVLVGHYKMGGRPGIGARNAACLDYPDQPCAYRWRGGEELREEYLVSLNAAAGP
jgi:hypothetical protein